MDASRASTSAPIAVLVIGPMPELEHALEATGRYELLRLWTSADREAWLREVGKRVRAIATHSVAGRLNAGLLDLLPQLEIIVFAGAGYESIDPALAHARGIVVTNTPLASSVDTAELAIGLMLALARGVVTGDRHVRARRWPQRRTPTLRRMSGRTLGVWGLGAVGSEVARLAAAFGMSVAYHNRRPRGDVPYRHVAAPVDLAREVDFLVVALPGGAGTFRVVDRTVLEAPGPDAYLVSVGRGTAIDEDALAACLREGVIAGAALDVFAEEPVVPEAFMDLPNIILSPHVGGDTRESNAARFGMAFANLEAHFAGAPLTGRVA